MIELPSTRRDFLKQAAGLAAGVTLGASALTALTPSRASAGPVFQRKNAKDLSAQEIQDYVDAVLALKQTPSPWSPTLSTYDQFVWWHKKSFNCDIEAAHMQPSFLPWHRQYLLLFEEQLSIAAGQQIAIPYWDWTDQDSTDAIFSNDFMGGNGNPNEEWALTKGPFRRGQWKLNVLDPAKTGNWSKRWIVRNFGAGGYALPTKKEVNASLEVPEYDTAPWDPSSPPSKSFRNSMEGWRGQRGMKCVKGLMEPDPIPGTKLKSQMHNAVHLYVGGLWGKDFSKQGTMVFNTSVNDPVFFLHHCNIDRLWWEWEGIHGQVYKPAHGLHHGQNRHDTMWPYNTIGINTTINELLDVNALGYDYA